MASQDISLSSFLDLSADELKFYLQQRGQPSAGTHGSLAARALIAHEQRLPIMVTAETISSQLQKDYHDIITKNALPTDPFEGDIAWSDDVTRFPSTNIGQVFSYILRCKAFSTEYLGQYKVRKAFSFFISGFVDKIFISPLQDGRTLIKTAVVPSQRLNDEKHKLWVLFSSTGDVLTACCTCTAGLCQCCNHVVAALYKIDYANEKGLTDPACTELPCVWNSNSRTPEPMKIKDMKISKHNATKTPQYSINSEEKYKFDPRVESDRTINEREKNDFLSQVKSTLPNAVLNILYAPAPAADVPPSLVEIVDTIQNKLPNASPDLLLASFGEELSFNDSQIAELEKVTRNQAASDIWSSQRKGRVTASNFHDVYTKVNALLRKGGKPVKVIPLLTDLLTPKDIGNLPSIKWGRGHELCAAEAFMRSEGAKHDNPKLDQCGLFVLKSHPYIGATPGNIFHCKCCSTRYCVEYKCPYSVKDEDIVTAWEKTNFLEKRDDLLHLKKTHKYYTQVIGQLALTGCKEGYFVVWTSKGAPFVERISFDEKYWGKVLSNLIVLSKSYIQAVLLGIREISTCPPVCDLPCLDKSNLNATDEDCITCNLCGLKYHLTCFPTPSNMCHFCKNNDNLLML